MRAVEESGERGGHIVMYASFANPVTAVERLLRLALATLETRDHARGQDAGLRQFGEIPDQLRGDAIAQVLGVAVATGIDEWQHRNGSDFFPRTAVIMAHQINRDDGQHDRTQDAPGHHQP